MRHPLESRIAALRGQVRRLLAAHGFAWLVLGLIAAITLAGSLDWLIHLVPEVRLVLLIGVGLGAAWLFARYVLAPLVVHFNNLDIALKIEQRWPGLNDRLASTIQFLHARGDDDSLGSKAMRDATIAQTIEETKAIDFREAIDARPARLALQWSSLAVMFAVFLLVFVPMSSRIALARLFMPFGSAEWPKLTHLTIVADETAHKAARGEPFSLAVGIAKGEHMPSSAKVTFKFADGETSEEPLRPADDGVFRGRLETATRDFTFTVAAGDDQTAPWDVKVVPPPVLTELTVKIIPPAYTGLPPQTLAPGNTQPKAVFGSQIELSGKSNKQLASAGLRLGDVGAKDPVQLVNNGLGVFAKFSAATNVPFWLELKDTEGFKNQEVVRYDLRTVPDETPRVSFEEPTNDRDVPAKAIVPIQIGVDDDFGIHSIRMIYKVAAGGSEPAKEVILPLWDGTAKKDTPPSKHEVVNHRWDLAPLNLEPGTILSFHADARDFDNVKGPNIGKSRELRLRIVSDDEAGRQIEEQQRALRDDLERTHAMQKQAQTPVDDALRTLARTNRPPAPVRDNLRNAETIQRQVTSRITSKSDGIEQKINRITNDLKNFNIPNQDVERQMLAMKQTVDKLKQQNLTPAEQSLTRGGKALDEQANDKNQPEAGAQPQPQGNDQAQAKADPQAGAQSKGADTPPETGAQGQQDKPQNDGAQSKSQQKGDQSKGQQGDQSKGQQGDQSKGQQGDQSKGQQGDQSKGQQGDQSKGQQGDQSKGQQGDQSKGQQGDQSKSKQGGQQSKGQQSKGQQSKGQQGDQSKGQQPQQGGDQQQAQDAGDQKKPAPQLALNDAAKNQKAIAEDLKKMLDNMSEFDTYRGVVKEAKSLLQQQEQAMKQSAEAANKPDLMSKTPEALSPEQKAELENLGARQAELAKLLQNFEAKLDEMAKKVEKDDPLAAAALKEASKQSRQKATAAKMSEGAEQLGKNQMGQARQNQDQARNDLKELVDSIQNRRERELARLVQEMKQAEADLKNLRARQAANLKKTAEAKKMTDPKAREKELQKLAKEQAEIQKELQKQLQKLAKLGAEGAAQKADNAAAKMAKAEQDLNQDQGEQAEEDMEEALNNLRQAQQELAENRRDAEEQLAMEQISKMSDSLKSIAERQQKMIGETTGYEQSRAKNDGKLSIAQRTGVRDLGRVESSLKDETAELIERLGEGAPVFTLTLKRAMTSMDDAASKLQALKTDNATVASEKSAASRFKQLLDSMKPDKMKKADGDAGDEQQGGGGGGGGGGGDNIPAAAQIKMLKMLQQELNDRTDELDQLIQRGEKLSPDQEAERAKLHEDQGALADLVRDLTRPKQADGEDD